MKVIEIDPKEIKVESNVRFGLKPYRVDRLAEDIANVGRVETPVEIYANGDGEYVLLKGGYRHAAVSKLNEQGAGMTLPAVVVDAPDAKTRIRRQVAENQERENMSPMDKAVAMKQLLEAGVPRPEIRSIFAAAGGRKGVKVQPLSNSSLNIHLKFLDFPKAIQNKIHDGILGIGVAMELQKHQKEEWQVILDAAEAARIKAIDKEEAEEEKLLREEKKAIETSQAAETVKSELEKKEAELAAAVASAKEKGEASAKAFQARQAIGVKAEERPGLERAYKAADAEYKTARKEAEELTKEVAKLKGVATKKEEAAVAARAKIEAARKEKADKAAAAKAGKAAPSTKLTGRDVKKAAKETATTKTAPVKLNASEMREVVHTLTLPGGSDKVAQIATILERCFNGEITDKQCFAEAKKIR